MSATPTIRLTPAGVGIALLVVIELLITANVAVHLASGMLGESDGYGFFRLFDLNAEAPGGGSCSRSCSSVSTSNEGAEIHELFTRVARFLTGGATVPHFDWLIIATPLLVVFLIAYVRFLLHMAPGHRYRFIANGLVFVVGAVGMEALGGVVADRYGLVSRLYFVMTTLEETLEMLGIAGFIVTLLIYLRSQSPNLRIDFGSGRTPQG